MLKSILRVYKAKLKRCQVIFYNLFFSFKSSLVFTASFHLAGNFIDFSVSPLDYRASILLFNRQDHKIAFLRDICANLPKPIFIDIGANYGEFSVLLKPYVSSLIAVEPNPYIYKHLASNIFQNFPSQIPVTLISAACTGEDFLNHNSSISFVFDTSYSGGARLLRLNCGLRTSGPLMFYGKSRVIDVTTVSVYDLLHQDCSELAANKHAVIKIDTEGSELSILSDLVRWLDSGVNQFASLSVLFEYNSNSFNDSEAFFECLKNFETAGFSFVSINSNIDLYRGPFSLSVAELDLSTDQEIFLTNHCFQYSSFNDESFSGL